MTTSINNGNQLTVVGVEQSLGVITDPGNYQIGVDLDELELGDEIVIRVKVKVTPGGVTRTVYAGIYANPQGETANVLSIPVPSTNEVEFTILQFLGSPRTFPWEIWRL